MKLTVLFLFLSLFSFSQRLQPIELTRHDSIAIKEISLQVKKSINRKIITIWLSERFKITASTRVTLSNKNGRYVTALIKDNGNTYGFGDYLDVLTYDIRAKFYITRYNGLIFRFFSNGLQPKLRIYSLGWNYKF